MLENLSIATFADRVGQTFMMCLDDTRKVPITLSQVTDLTAMGGPNAVGRPRAPFSLLFQGPPEFVLPQRIYRLEHETLEPFDVFLVPLGRDAVGVRYEAVFT